MYSQHLLSEIEHKVEQLEKKATLNFSWFMDLIKVSFKRSFEFILLAVEKEASLFPSLYLKRCEKISVHKKHSREELSILGIFNCA